MRRGPKGATPEEKSARGTLQPCRAGAAAVTIADPGSLPQRPEWLTPAGEAVWLDVIGRISSVKGAAEVDSDLVGNYCNLQGMIVLAWKAGAVPPITALMEARKLQEMLRIAGPSSRISKVGEEKAGGGNPFLKARR